MPKTPSDNPKIAEVANGKPPTTPFSILHSPFSILNPLRWLGLLLLFILPALLPLLSHDFTDGYDNAFHLWRAVEIRALFSEGIWYSRWAPHMAHGYGYPLYLFQSPLSAYIAALFSGLGLSWGMAINATYALAYGLTAVTMWLLTRDLWGERGGLLAAIAFTYAPYHAYVTFYRASMSETVAWIFPPLILWGLRRWQHATTPNLPNLGGGRLGLATAVIAFILLTLSHDATAYGFLPLLIGWVIVGEAGLGIKARLRGFGVLLLGIAGSSFFWWPTFIERHHIQFAPIADSWPFRYFDNFLPLSQLFALPHQADPNLLNDWPPRAIGLVLAGLALAGLLIGLKRVPRQRWLIAYLGLALAAYSFMTLAISQFLWDWLTPLSAFTPWRFLAPATFCAALLTGGLINITASGQRQSRLAGLLIVGLIAAHLGWFYPRYAPVPSDTSLTGMVAWEEMTATLGTTAKNELLPIWVQQMPRPEGDVPVWKDRLPTAVLPPNTHISQQENSPLAFRAELDTPEPFTATFNIFYFPGWTAELNGRSHSITPSEPHGLISLDLPAGHHTIRLQFGETAAWRLADLISLLSLLLLAGLVWRTPAAPDRPLASISQSPHWGWAVLAILLLLLKVGVVDRGQILWRQTRLTADGRLPHLAQSAELRFGDQIEWLGLDDWPRTLPADAPLPLTLYWRSRQPIERDYRVGLTLVDGDGRRWSLDGLRDSRWGRTPPPTPNWPPDQYVRTAYLLDALPATPPGEYHLQLSLFDRETLTPLTISDGNGRSLGPYYDLGQLTLTPPRTPTAPADIPMQFRHEVSGEKVTVWGSNLDRTAVAPGDTVLVTLFWSANGANAEQAHELALALINETGEIAATWPIPLPAYPSGVWRLQNLFRVPIDVADGAYQWRLIWPEGTQLDWSQLTVSTPQRIMERPLTPIQLDETFGGEIALVGGDMRQQGEQLEVMLIWQAQREILTSYTVFVHLIAPDGTLVAQSDALPAQWSRPTTGWLPGEYIRDHHTLTLPPSATLSDYEVRVGLYVGDARLPTVSGNDYAILTTP